ncbi:MAG: Uma2 family endonuclease [Gemmataceae bacterium]|nr:Uma2 family endonuclease [Gemmataceae bacterium]
MSSATTLMTTEDLLALPDNGTDRELIRGELRERPMTRRNKHHSGAEANIAAFLKIWLLQQPAPRGKIHSGEAGCILRRNPDTTVGIDVCYVSAETARQQSDETELIEGPPILAVEVLSPKDVLEEVEDKINEYLAAGVQLTWVVNPYRRTVTVYRPDTPPQFYNHSQELSGEPHLPGFTVPVAAIFE